MKQEFKFKLITYLKYLLIEPWTENISLPNFRTLIWIALFVSTFLRNFIFMLIFAILGIIAYAVNEYKSGKYIYLYRQKKYRERNEALKKVREKRKEKFEKIELPKEDIIPIVSVEEKNSKNSEDL